MIPAQKLAQKLKRKPNDVSPRGRGSSLVCGPLECKLREFRHKYGLRQIETADAIGVHVSLYCCIERGARLDLDVAAKIAAFFGVPITKIWTDLPE